MIFNQLLNDGTKMDAAFKNQNRKKDIKQKNALAASAGESVRRKTKDISV